MLITPGIGWRTGEPLSLAYQGGVDLISGTTTQDHTGLAFGVATPKRLIIAAVTIFRDGSTPPAVISVTIGGVSATLADPSVTGETYLTWAYAIVPTGTTGTISIVMSASPGSPDATRVDWWRATGTTTNPMSHSVTNNIGPAIAASLTIPSGGFGLGFVGVGYASLRTIAWTNLTEETDHQWTSNKSTSSVADSIVSGTLTRTATASGSLSGPGQLLLAAWGP
jgi:hypothetical protein